MNTLSIDVGYLDPVSLFTLSILSSQILQSNVDEKRSAISSIIHS